MTWLAIRPRYVPKLVFACWWVGSDPGEAGWGAQGVLELVLVCWWVGRGHRDTSTGAASLVVELGSEVPRCWFLWVPEMVLAHWWVELGQESPRAVVYLLVGGVRSWDLWLWGIWGSQSSCWPASGRSQGPGSPGASPVSPVGRAKSWGHWLQSSGV